jgi:hypothetical protein
MIRWIFVFIVITVPLKGQVLVSCGGNEFSNNSLIMSYSIGESAIEPYRLEETNFNQGYQQSNWDSRRPSDKVNFFPNPTSGVLNYYLPVREQTMRYLMYNVQGQMLEEGVLDGTPLNITRLNKGIYLLWLYYSSLNYWGYFKVEKY